jgi:hypothetical protein
VLTSLCEGSRNEVKPRYAPVLSESAYRNKAIG